MLNSSRLLTSHCHVTDALMRILFAVSSAAIALSASGAQTPQAARPRSQVPGDLLPDEQVQQVLNRLPFGARPGDAEQVRSVGIESWIDQQLHPDRIDDTKTTQLIARYSIFGTPTTDIVRDFNLVQQTQRQVKQADENDTSMTKGDIRRDAIAQNPQLVMLLRQNQQLVGQVQSASLARAVTSERQLNEVMVDFWENHFSVFSGKGQTRLFLAQYDRDVIRPNALGKFRDLLGAVAKSPAMLFFLDNWESAADSTQPTLAANRGGGRGGRPGVIARRPGRIGFPGQVGRGQVQSAVRERLQNGTPGERQRLMQQLQQRARRGLNENYGRELIELHTLGVDGGYTQKDVQEVARALTGWTFQ